MHLVTDFSIMSYNLTINVLINNTLKMNKVLEISAVENFRFVQIKLDQFHFYYTKNQ